MDDKTMNLFLLVGAGVLLYWLLQQNAASQVATIPVNTAPPPPVTTGYGTPGIVTTPAYRNNPNVSILTNTLPPGAM